MAGDISFANASFNATFSEAILYGIYVALFPVAMFLLLTRSRTNVNICLTVVTLFMFLLSSSHMVMVIQYANTTYVEDSDPTVSVYIPVILEIINCYVADAIVFWRAWVLWGKTWKCLAIPLALWLATVAGGIGNTTVIAVPSASSGSAASATSIASWTLAFAVTTCFANLWAVGMIGYRYYIYHKEVVAVLGRRRANYRTLLVLIIESGMLYCLSWLLLIILYVSDYQGACLLLGHLIAQLTGIYPTMIIVVVCLRLTQQDDIDRFYSSIRGLTSGSSATMPSGLRITREPALNAGGSVAYSPTSGLGEIKDMEGPDTMAELTELDGISRSVDRKYSPPV